MATLLPKNDLELHRAFEIILSIESFSNHINEISELIYNDELDNETLQIVLKRNGIDKLEEIKEELLDLLLVYINLILNDHIISENERKNLKILKMYFKVREGDFIKYRKPEVEYVLQRQFERVYMDNEVDERESIHKVNLQEVFDLSYDQFEKFKETEVIRALERGADISKLDTINIPKYISNLNPESNSRSISQNVKDLVWNRDGGRCVQCSSNLKLEFDHIIPFSKGGSNTYRNIQLLCETCNRKKSNSIG